jgi:L-lactate dehydrogenase complex protein LldF
MSSAAQEFLRRADEKAFDLRHRDTIRHGIDSYEAAHNRGKARFSDWQAARDRSAQIKAEALSKLHQYLLQFEQAIQSRGGHVFWAANSEEARNYVLDLARKCNVQRVIKSKSMVTEEIHLNPLLETNGIEVWETDLGEYIVQLRNEPPYHIVTPAMHLSRGDIAQLFQEKIGGVTSDDPSQLVALARRKLRQAFFAGQMGISGANFLVADAGMVAINTNEGNGRLCTTLPRIHVVMAGIEKVIPRLQDLATLWPVLATAGTGQHLTTYCTLIGGARRSGEVDGPEEFHVVLLDNGRTELLADTEQRDVLRCIRCGACLNACPIFRNVGGHTYGTTYQGPIGSVLTPHLRGLKEFNHLSFASSLCGACTEICPVRIDLHHHLLQNRRNAVDSGSRPWSERVAFKIWRWVMLSSRRFRFFGWLGRKIMKAVRALGLSGTALDPMRKWTKYRVPPDLPDRSFREMWKREYGAGH